MTNTPDSRPLIRPLPPQECLELIRNWLNECIPGTERNEPYGFRDILEEVVATLDAMKAAPSAVTEAAVRAQEAPPPPDQLSFWVYSMLYGEWSRENYGEDWHEPEDEDDVRSFASTINAMLDRHADRAWPYREMIYDVRRLLDAGASEVRG